MPYAYAMKRLLLTLAAASALRPLALDVPRGGIKKHAEKASRLATVGAAFFAATELSEGLLAIGHHHGLALIAVSKLARGLQQAESVAVESSKRLGRLLRAPITLPLVCLAAIVTSAWEVWKDARLDAKIGGHHGMLILALYELQEVVEDAAGENSSRGRFGKLIHFRPLKLALALGALGAAGLELSEDLRPGAHHGVALLAGVLVVKTCVSIWEAK